MRLALHIFRKDLERLWPMVLVTFALLGLFAYYDASHPIYVWGATFPQGTWLNLVLPFAWCFLAGLAILQDSLVGDRQFWVVLPCNWRVLLLAKIAFVGMTIAIPYLLATSIILIAHGFNPFLYIPHLLWKQLLVLAAIIPAVALATVVRNIGQFLLAEITVLSAMMFLGNAAYQRGQAFRYFPWDVRWSLALVILSAGGLFVVMTQFAGRRTALSRGLAVVTVIAAAALYNEMSRDTSAAIREHLAPAPEALNKFSVRLNLDRGSTISPRTFYAPDRTLVVVPLKFSGAIDRFTRFEEISVAMTSADGRRYEASWPRSTDEVRAQRIMAFVQGPAPDGYASLDLQFFNDAVAKALLAGPVTVTIRLLVQSNRSGPSTPLRQSSWINAPEVGRCVVHRSENPRIPGEPLITAECESPNLDVTEMAVTGPRFVPFRDEASFRPGGLGGDAWLSPIHRGAQILFPNYADADAHWSVTALHTQGAATVDFTIPNLNLNDYVGHDPRAKAAK